jgi:hypothetical protein
MLNREEENYILTHAYIPEHIVGLMTYLCDGEPFLMDDYFGCRKNDWTILVGYPLERNFILEKFECVIEKIKKQIRPRTISLIAPELPLSISTICKESDSDHYYTLNAEKPTIPKVIQRNLKKARQTLRIERSSSTRSAHDEVMREFIDRVNPPVRVQNLLFKMPGYIGHADSCFVLNAWDSNDHLTAFYVVDLAAKDFSNYIIGCYSKQNYVLGASDLLLFELIEMSVEYGKSYIHLGLGVNKGIRRFKEKWGGRPTLRYEMCELALRKLSMWEAIKAIGKF